MIKENKCKNCERWFRGNGFKDVCTSECFYKAEYAIKFNVSSRIETPFDKESEYNEKKRKQRLDASNKKWLDRTISEETPKSRYETNEKLNRKRTHGNPKWEKKFTACRG